MRSEYQPVSYTLLISPKMEEDKGEKETKRDGRERISLLFGGGGKRPFNKLGVIVY